MTLKIVVYCGVYDIFRSKVYYHNRTKAKWKNGNMELLGFYTIQELVSNYLKTDCDKLKMYTVNPKVTISQQSRLKWVYKEHQLIQKKATK